MNRTQGDPRLFLTERGATIKFIGGQPVMDGGWENYVLISLFTRPGWVGNVLFDKPSQRIGSDFEETAEQAITIDSLADLEESGKRALADMIADGLAEKVEVIASNPSGDIRNVRILITPPGKDVEELLLTKHGLNWLVQANDPAHKRYSDVA